MARPTRVMAKQVTAVSAISGPTAASSARGSAEAVVVAARREPVTSLVGLEETSGEKGGKRASSVLGWSFGVGGV